MNKFATHPMIPDIYGTKEVDYTHDRIAPQDRISAMRSPPIVQLEFEREQATRSSLLLEYNDLFVDHKRAGTHTSTSFWPRRFLACLDTYSSHSIDALVRTVQVICTDQAVVEHVQWNSILEALRDPQWTFRTSEGLAGEKGFPQERIDALLRIHRSEVQIAPLLDSKKRILYTARERRWTWRTMQWVLRAALFRSL